MFYLPGILFRTQQGQPMYQNYEKRKEISILNILSEIGGIFTILMLILGGVKTGTLLLSRAVEQYPSLQWMVCLCATHSERASKFYKHLNERDDPELVSVNISVFS